jgi:hypothetical protein
VAANVSPAKTTKSPTPAAGFDQSIPDIVGPGVLCGKGLSAPPRAVTV